MDTAHNFRGPTDFEHQVSLYEAFVQSLSEGYSMCIYEYTNDLSCRQRLEDHKSEPAAKVLWSRVEKADEELKSVLLPTKKCIHGDYPKPHFWFWGYPPNSPELEEDLRAIEAI